MDYTCRYDIDNGEIHFIYYFYILKRSTLSRGYDHHSCRLVSFFCVTYIHRCANILARYHTPSPAAGITPTPNSVLINGLGRYSGGPNSPLAVINVSAGKRYRFRLVSISCDPNFIFSIGNHNLVSFFIFPRFHSTEEPTIL